MITEEEFREIKTRWRGEFKLPYEGRATSWDFGMRVALSVLEDGKTVFEDRDNLAEDLIEPGAVEDMARRVKEDLLSPTTNKE